MYLHGFLLVFKSMTVHGTASLPAPVPGHFRRDNELDYGIYRYSTRKQFGKGNANNNNACVRDMQIEHTVNTRGQTVFSSLILQLAISGLSQPESLTYKHQTVLLLVYFPRLMCTVVVHCGSLEERSWHIRR
jgi:hypothetical protein